MKSDEYLEQIDGDGRTINDPAAGTTSISVGVPQGRSSSRERMKTPDLVSGGINMESKDGALYWWERGARAAVHPARRGGCGAAFPQAQKHWRLVDLALSEVTGAVSSLRPCIHLLVASPQGGKKSICHLQCMACFIQVEVMVGASA